MTLPTVLLVGRPNVGKSTLFNRLTGGRALVDARPGSTRDLNEAPVRWNGRRFLLLDSGGWTPGDAGSLADRVAEKVREALGRAAAVVLVVDAKDGPLESDRALAQRLRESGADPLLVVNKADSPEEQETQAADFFTLGIPRVFVLSALHGLGVDALLDALAETVGIADSGDEEPVGVVRLVLLGRPNVGKSSLFNRLVGQNRQLVDETPGTTRDPVALEVPGGGVVAVDTAGIRPRRQVDTSVEEKSVARSLEALRTCHAALVVLDAGEGVRHQDAVLAREVADAFRAVVVVVNKWDLRPKGLEHARAEREIRRKLRPLDFAPVLFVSAKTGRGCDRILPEVLGVVEECRRRFPTPVLNRILQELSERRPPKTPGAGPAPRLLYAVQRAGAPPAFKVFARRPECLSSGYRRYLERGFREALGIPRAPLRFAFRPAREREGNGKRRSGMLQWGKGKP